jgi:hypothetical protein
MSQMGHERRTQSDRGSGACPLRSESDRIAASPRMDATCHKPTYAVQQIAALFDQLVGAAERPAIFAERQLWNVHARGCRSYSGLMPANLITLANFSV